MNGARRRVLVVSHPAVVSVNQEVYRELARRGWEVTIVVPSRWRHSYSRTPIAPRPLDGLEGSLRPVPVVFAGHPQRHLYLTRCRALAARVRPDVAFVEAEPYALAATQWGRALARLGVPFGVQCYENIDRPLPPPVRRLRSRVLRDAAFVAARSETAAGLARAWGARGEVGLAPPAVPAWESGPAVRAQADEVFTVGYAGRLVESKGLLDLLGAVRELQAPVELLLDRQRRAARRARGSADPRRTGARARRRGPRPDGRRLRPLRRARAALAHDREVEGAVRPRDRRGAVVRRAGRRLGLGRDPVADRADRRGLVFPEGDRVSLAAHLNALRDSPELRGQLAHRGRATVERLFTVPAATDALERLLASAAGEGAARAAGEPTARADVQSY